MTGTERWPPLIVATHVPWTIRLRDTLLTLLAWAAFVLLVDEEFKLTFGVLDYLGLGEVSIDTVPADYLPRLFPFLAMSAVLALLLGLFSMRTLRRRARALQLPAPAPLEAAEQARDAGLDERALIAARDERVVIVHSEEAGVRIVAKDG
jgi:poly-beta-1,6-N-acetyl-D-glucosamine biosynthesis protein PgaD